MNNKGSKKSYIAVIVILICALVLVFYLLESAKMDYKAKPITKKTTETINVLDPEESEKNANIPVEVPSEVADEKIESIPFATNLQTIIGNKILIENYKINIVYSGTKFSFKCTTYDESTVTCLEGSALMTVNDVPIPLFTYSNTNENFFERSKDFYIIVTENNIIVSYSNVGISPGVLKVYDKKGELLTTDESVILGYRFNGEMKRERYPIIMDNIMYYNACENNQVVTKKIDYNLGTNFETVNVVPNSICY